MSIKLTIGGCPLRADIKREVESRVGVHPGVRDVKISWGEMTPDERTDVMLKARWNARQNAGDTQVPASTRVLAIASGKGGVGKSSVTVNLAVALAKRGRTVGVLDADIWGFSIPRLLGMSERLEAAKDADTGRAADRAERAAGRRRQAEGGVHRIPRRRGHRARCGAA